VRGVPVYHNVKYTKGLTGRQVYAGIYTTDLIIVSSVAWAITIMMKGQDIELIYLIIALVCLPIYIFLVIKNKSLPSAWFIFIARRLLGGRKISIKIREEHGAN
jgi:hypothetical protein